MITSMAESLFGFRGGIGLNSGAGIFRPTAAVKIVDDGFTICGETD